MTDDVSVTITEFLLARIVEDESVAHSVEDADGGMTVAVLGDTGVVVPQARLLAESWTKRRLIEIHPGASEVSGCRGCGALLDGSWRTPPGQICPVLAALAVQYAHHPDYREEWRPGDGP